MKRVLAGAMAGMLIAGGVGLGAAQSAEAALSCSTSLPAKTQGKGTCTGSGTWRLKVACKLEPDGYTSYVRQTQGTTSLYKECTFQATGAWAEVS